MIQKNQKSQTCSGGSFQSCFPIQKDAKNSEVCCGPPAGPPSSRHEKPGYTLCSYVEGFVETPAGPVPRVKRRLENRDWFGAATVRIGIGRNQYKIAPGLYGVGRPDPEAPVLVTANYKLSFDALRKELSGLHVWILVLDTRGINVWCAAGKKTFSTGEVVRQVKQTGLERVIRHKKLILPQLAATGVSAGEVKKRCGFEVIWGPVRAGDIPVFIKDGFKADPGMRQVTFSLWERVVLVPVEISALQKYVIWMLASLFVISGVSMHIFSFSQAWQRGGMAVAAVVAGVLAGAVAVPILLPWIPGKAFSIKGLVAGMIAGAWVTFFFRSRLGIPDAAALVLLSASFSSYLAMNFTGATPYTSPSGVEKEMRIAIPGQAGAVIIAMGLWIGSAFA